MNEIDQLVRNLYQAGAPVAPSSEAIWSSVERLTGRSETGKAWRGLFPPPGRHWRVPPAELDELEARGLIERSRSGNPRKIVYADDVDRKGTKVQDVWTMKDPQYPVYPTEKNLEMLSRIIEASSSPGDIVLDCFAGSGTTLEAAERLQRRWIGIDQSPTAIRTALERLKNNTKVTPFSLLQLEETTAEHHHEHPFQHHHATVRP